MDDFAESTPLNLQADAFVGAVDNARLTKVGAFFTCWAVTASNSRESLPPARFIVAAGDKVVAAVAPHKRRQDIAAKFGSQTLICGAELTVGAINIPAPLVPDFTFYAMSKDGLATKLPFFKPNNHLAEVRITSGNDFIRLIQNPSTRIADPQCLAYTAFHALGRFPTDFGVRAASLCVIGYRVLNREVDDGELRSVFDSECRRLLAEQPSIPGGQFLRWHTSVRLIAGYLAYQQGDDESAMQHFAAIIPFTQDLTLWPQALTNLLLGIYLSGYMQYASGNVDAAVAYWSKAPSLFRFGCSIAEFQNYYAYGELGNALKVVQESYVAVQVSTTGGPIKNPAVAPTGRTIDLRQLPSPFGRLLAEREKAVVRAAL